MAHLLRDHVLPTGGSFEYVGDTNNGVEFSPFGPSSVEVTQPALSQQRDTNEIVMEDVPADSDEPSDIADDDDNDDVEKHRYSINSPHQDPGHEQRNSEFTKKAVSSSDELEVYPTALPEEVGSKLDEKGEKVPWYWRIYYAFFPGTKEEIRPWSFGVLMDVIFLLLIVVVLVALYHDEPEKVREAWFFPLLGIFAAIISTSTPAGGGVVFFPFMVLIDVKPVEAAAFSMTTQAFSMGVFGAGQWIRKAPKGLIVYWMVFIVVAGSWGGVLISMLLLPITNGGALEAFFLVFVIFLAIYVLYGLIKGELQTQNQKVKKHLVNIVALLTLGVLGGLLVGYIAVGIDIMFFVLMTFIYKANSNMATVDSILIMGWSCWLPAFLNIVAFDDLRFNYVLMTLIGSVLGARIGPALNIILGRKYVLIAFEFLLVIEILRAIAYLFLAPLIFSGSEFFWAGDYSE